MHLVLCDNFFCFDYKDVLSEPVKQSMSNVSTNPVRRTPESFLGPNSNLVNLDALVSSNKVQNCKLEDH